jgi:DNA-binding TFAR19-related protein (PDSD5 family)
MSELEELKRKRLLEMQAAAEEQAQLKQQVEQIESIVKSTFTKEALQRYGNLKSAHPEKAIQVLVYFGQLIQAGKVQQVDDEMLKAVLSRLAPPVRQIRITRK